VIDPSMLVSHDEPMNDALQAYQRFDRREPGWTKVALMTAPGGSSNGLGL
jgi:glutathione-independent formaldehyde dehydrogenase